MALTKEVLTANAVLSGLTEEQQSAIVTLSQNDENAVIGKRIGEIYRDLDATIERSTGIARNGDEKTYNYLERAALSMKERADESDTLRKQVEGLTKDKTKLEKAIAEGATDAEARKALEQARRDLSAMTKQVTDLQQKYDEAGKAHAAEIFGLKLNHELGAAAAGIKFKAEYPKAVTDVLMSQAFEKIKAMKPEYIDDEKGGKILVFKNEDGSIKRNPKNVMNISTAAEILEETLKPLGVLDEGRRQTGAGTSGGGARVSAATAEISGAKTRVEANDIATKMLLAKGLVKGTSQFQKELDQIWKDNNIMALPER